MKGGDRTSHPHRRQARPQPPWTVRLLSWPALLANVRAGHPFVLPQGCPIDTYGVKILRNPGLGAYETFFEHVIFKLV